MADFKEGLKCAKKIARDGIRILGPIAVFLMFNHEKIGRTITEIRHNVDATYDDVIDVINNSGMLGSYKCKALDLLKVGQSSEYYRSIIKTVQSNSLGSHKLKMIETINNNFEKGEA